MNLPKQLTTPTKESKYLSFLLIFALPIISGFLVYVNMKEIWDNKLLKNMRRATDLRIVPLQNNAAFSINELTSRDLLQTQSTPSLIISAYGKIPETTINNAKTGYYPVVINISGIEKPLLTDRVYFGTPEKIFHINNDQILVVNGSRNSIDFYEYSESKAKTDVSYIESLPLDTYIDGTISSIACEEDICTIKAGVGYDAGCSYIWEIGTKNFKQFDCFYAL